MDFTHLLIWLCARFLLLVAYDCVTSFWLNLLLNPWQRRQDPLNSVPFVCSSLCLFVTHFSRNPFISFSKPLAQVRGPGVQKSDRDRFLGKTPFWVISAKNDQKFTFLPISRNFIVTFDCNLCQNVLHMVTNQITPSVSPGKLSFLAFW